MNRPRPAQMLDYSDATMLRWCLRDWLRPHVEWAAGTVVYPLATWDEALAHVRQMARVAARRAKYADLVPIDPLCSDLLGEAVAALDAEHCQLYWILRDEALLAFGAGYDKQVVAHGTARLVDYPFPPDLLAHAVQRAAREHYWATRKRGV